MGMKKIKLQLNKRKNYLQIAFNSNLIDAKNIIYSLPASERIILEAGTPLIKKYGIDAVRLIRNYYATHLTSQGEHDINPYVVADLKVMDRAETEVRMAATSGASAVVALGSAPIETLNAFMDACYEYNIDPMIDMMNIENPLPVLYQLKITPPIIILHRGVDEENFNKQKQLPLYDIRRIKGAFNSMIAIAGGDTARDVQRAMFNDADIVVIWKSVYANNSETLSLVKEFLREIK